MCSYIIWFPTMHFTRCIPWETCSLLTRLIYYLHIIYILTSATHKLSFDKRSRLPVNHSNTLTSTKVRYNITVDSTNLAIDRCCTQAISTASTYSKLLQISHMTYDIAAVVTAGCVIEPTPTERQLRSMPEQGARSKQTLEQTSIR